MLDFTAPYDFADDDALLDASLADPPPAPAWKPRVRGEPVDRSSPQYLQELQAAKIGLPHLARMHWLTAQLLDAGEKETRGHVRYRVKLETSDAAPEHCTRRGMMQARRVRWVWLSKPANFLDNLKRKIRKYPLLHPPEVMDCGKWLAALAKVADAETCPHGAPAAMLGFVSTTFEGTHTYGGQYAALTWRLGDDDEAWWPQALVTQYVPAGTSSIGMPWDVRIVRMHPPPAVNRDGTERKSRFVHVGRWYSDALQERITAGKQIKAMRAAHIAETTGRRP